MSLLCLWPYTYIFGSPKTHLTPAMSPFSGKQHKTQISKIWLVSLYPKLSKSLCLLKTHLNTLNVSPPSLGAHTYLETENRTENLEISLKRKREPNYVSARSLSLTNISGLENQSDKFYISSLYEQHRSAIESFACQPLFETYNISHYERGNLTQNLYLTIHVFSCSLGFSYISGNSKVRIASIEISPQKDIESASCLSSFSSIHIYIFELKNLN